MGRVIILADMEGAAGIGNVKECFPWYPEYHKHGVVQLAGDVNAAVRGLRVGGIEDIVVYDGHLFCQNLSDSQLEPHVKLVRSWRKLFEEEFDGVVLLCYHAMAGTPNGFLSHTCIPFLRVRVNSQPVGETSLFSWLCGFYNIPTIMVTGDEIGVKEAKDFLPSVDTVAVKKARNREVAQCFPIEEMRRLIEETAMSAAQRLGEHRVYHAEEPVLLEVAFRTPGEADLAATLHRAKKTSPRVVAYKSEKYLEAFKFLFAAINLIVSGSWFDEIMQKLMVTQEGKRIFEEWNLQFTEQWLQEQQELWYE